MKSEEEILTLIETHNTEGIRECFKKGLSPNTFYQGKPLIHELINGYLRGTKFRDCVKAFIDFGFEISDEALLAVLTDNRVWLKKIINEQKDILQNKYTFNCAFTPIYEASLLHICAEYNHVLCANILIERGLDVNVKAGCDANGFGGQTPIFHTVNQNLNASREMFDLLLEKNANLDASVKGLIWGKGFEWETFIPAVNPLSYAMFGLLPQMHRKQQDIANIIQDMLFKKSGERYTLPNIPCKYLLSE